MAVLVLGPSNAGKSTFISSQPDGEKAVFGSQISSKSDVPETGYIHYNLLHHSVAIAVAGGDIREWDLLSEQILNDIIASGCVKNAIVIVAPIAELLSRARKREHFEISTGQISGYDQGLWSKIISSVDFFALYERTFEMLDQHGIAFEVLYSSSELGTDSPSFLPSDRTLVHHNLRGAFISTPLVDDVARVNEMPGIDYQKLTLPRGVTSVNRTYGHVSEGRVKTFNILRDRTLAGRSVLDIGCATGDFLLRYERYGASALMGIELNHMRWSAAVAVAKLLHSRAEIRLENFLTAPISQKYDDVLILNVLHHVPDFKTFLAKAVEATGDRLIIEYPTLADNLFQRLMPVEGDFEQLPVVGVSSYKVDQTFVFTEAALSRLVGDLGDFTYTAHVSPIAGRKLLIFSRTHT
ncbi:methyltransferase domain-containing protein [Rhizobium sp. P32RR-XVIII]|uniref:methyltransferase domain-containing protein n=1 Tax=Rhizobium sp. P32RR-XVIII TaxID=2726738 RepID=UPI0014576BA2|nr:methyltransferase domain-containing protein [Rhizobium sp. P32RR-XVIII]NLS08145.1 methyltransferase domain-containing protein [Rhizobium sp. P32RR-XVIII]